MHCESNHLFLEYINHSMVTASIVKQYLCGQIQRNSETNNQLKKKYCCKIKKILINLREH